MLEGDSDVAEIVDLAVALKQDAFTGIVPLVVLLSEEEEYRASDFLAAGADEVVSGSLSERSTSSCAPSPRSRGDRGRRSSALLRSSYIAVGSCLGCGRRMSSIPSPDHRKGIHQ